jgi:NADH:ubiquinone oxidoreductase subunit 6 (subunit J)
MAIVITTRIRVEIEIVLGLRITIVLAIRIVNNRSKNKNKNSNHKEERENALEKSNVHVTYFQEADETFTSFLQIEAIGQGLYTYGSMWLMLASIILLLAMLGPITLCLRSSQDK